MKFSDGEKLILMMLSDVHKKLGIQGEINPTLVVESIVGGKEWGLRWQYSMLFDDSVEDPPEVKETVEILNMYRMLAASMQHLSVADQAKVHASTHASRLKFAGFDGNNDPHYGITTYLIDHLGRFTEHKSSDVNSHGFVPIDIYRRMARVLARHDAMKRLKLSADDIIAVLDA